MGKNILGFENISANDKGPPPNLVSPVVIEWEVSNIDENNIQSYEISIGTTPGGVDVLNWTNVGNVKSYTLSTTLSPSTTYYVNVRYVLKINSSTSEIFSSPAFTTPANGLAQIVTGDYYTCALSKAGAVKCWGFNNNGQLGYDDVANRADGNGAPYNMISIQPVSLGQPAKFIAAGSAATCAILQDDTLKCWGYNGAGNLGLDDSLNRGSTSSSLYNMASLQPIQLNQRVKSVLCWQIIPLSAGAAISKAS